MSFERVFGRAPEVTASAPGRVNLIGEHTDYNGGFVLPTPIPQHAVVEISARPDCTVRIASLEVGAGVTVESFSRGHLVRRGEWLDYVQGILHVLESDGYAVPGFDAVVHSEVPMGSGLSSSAALGVALLRALCERFELALDHVTVALMVQRSENEFVGAHVGIMDPLVASVGRAGEALFIDTHDLTVRPLPLPRLSEIVVVDSGIPHRHAGGEYNRRREECAGASALLGVPTLRALGLQDLHRIAELPAPYQGRARHVVTENARVLESVTALEGDDPARLGELLDQSHRSLRDDYEVSTPTVDRLVEALARQPGVLGARIMGGGFGGSVVALASAGAGREAAERAMAQYANETGESPALPVVMTTAETATQP